MDVIEAIRTRKTIRGYKPDPVPREIIREILEVASRSPSGVNAQPWEVTVVTGEALDKMRQGNLEMYASGATSNADLPFIPYEGKYRQRQVELAIQLFGLMGIAREDKEKRAQWEQRGYRYLDAPTVIILYKDRSVTRLLSLLDMGSFMHAICLVAWSYGLGTCIMNQGVRFPEVVRRCAHIPDSKQLIICITIGYPERDFPANEIKSKREPVDNFANWCGFD